MARSTKLTPAVEDAICEAVKHGASYRAAALAAGVSERTLHAWRERGRAAKSGRFLQFLQRLEAAEAEGECIATKQVFRAFTEPTIETVTEKLSDGTVKTRTTERPADAGMALRWLERRVTKWNPRQVVEHDGRIEGFATGPSVSLQMVFDDGEGEEAPAPGEEGEHADPR